MIPGINRSPPGTAALWGKIRSTVLGLGNGSHSL